MKVAAHREGLDACAWGSVEGIEGLGGNAGSGTIAQVLGLHGLLLDELGPLLSLLDLGSSVLEPNLDRPLGHFDLLGQDLTDLGVGRLVGQEGIFKDSKLLGRGPRPLLGGGARWRGGRQGR